MSVGSVYLILGPGAAIVVGLFHTSFAKLLLAALARPCQLVSAGRDALSVRGTRCSEWVSRALIDDGVTSTGAAVQRLIGNSPTTAQLTGRAIRRPPGGGVVRTPRASFDPRSRASPCAG